LKIKATGKSEESKQQAAGAAAAEGTRIDRKI
jgi:hypothetical protein